VNDIATTPLFKVLRDGVSCHGGAMRWPLPERAADGSWTPGAWVEVRGALVLCENGLHLTSTPCDWYVGGSALYLAEYDGEIIDDGSNKVCVRRARLVSVAHWSDHGVHHEGEHVITQGRVTAYGSASVRAYGSASVRAYDSASVTAYGSASVTASGSASVTASGSASVTAYDSASVRASDSASVTAYDSASVTAYDSASVTASGSASVRAYDSASVTASGSATLISTSWHSDSAQIALSQLAAHVDRRGGTLVLRSAKAADKGSEGAP
jgi:hypothetical protein